MVCISFIIFYDVKVWLQLIQKKKIIRNLKELKHTIEEETLIFQEMQDYSDTIILHQCKRRIESSLSKFSLLSKEFIDYLYRTNTRESLTQASTERFLRDTVVTKNWRKKTSVNWLPEFDWSIREAEQWMYIQFGKFEFWQNWGFCN